MFHDDIKWQIGSLVSRKHLFSRDEIKRYNRLRNGGAGFRPSEAHGGGWEGLWRGGMETSVVRVSSYHHLPSRKKRCLLVNLFNLK